MEDKKRMKNEIVYILCKLEQIFPPAFFASMVHVMIHLPKEAILLGQLVVDGCTQSKGNDIFIFNLSQCLQELLYNLIISAIPL